MPAPLSGLTWQKKTRRGALGVHAMSDIYGLLSKMSPEYLVQMAEEEISKAKKAQEKGRPLPDLTHISVIIFTRSFDRLPQSIWQDLSFLLINVFRGKRGPFNRSERY